MKWERWVDWLIEQKNKIAIAEAKISNAKKALPRVDAEYEKLTALRSQLQKDISNLQVTQQTYVNEEKEEESKRLAISLQALDEKIKKNREEHIFLEGTVMVFQTERPNFEKWWLFFIYVLSISDPDLFIEALFKGDDEGKLDALHRLITELAEYIDPDFYERIKIGITAWSNENPIPWMISRALLLPESEGKPKLINSLLKMYTNDLPPLLIEASKRGYLDLVHFLLATGANINVTNDNNKTALDESSAHPDVINLLTLWRDINIDIIILNQDAKVRPEQKIITILTNYIQKNNVMTSWMASEPREVVQAKAIVLRINEYFNADSGNDHDGQCLINMNTGKESIMELKEILSEEIVQAENPLATICRRCMHYLDDNLKKLELAATANRSSVSKMVSQLK